MGIQINGQTDSISAVDGSISIQGGDLGSASASNLNISGIVTASGGVVVSAGSTSAPSISPVGDSNTGIFFPSPDTVCIGEGGTEVIRVDSSGNVGIATNNPASTLDVGGEITIRRSAAGNEGGQINFARASDNAVAWNIDAFGSTSTPSLRFIDSTASAVRMQIDGSGRVVKPYTPHIFGSPTNTSTVSNSFANSFAVVTSTELTFASDRITVPVAGIYLITFCSISNLDSSRKDIYIYVNGTIRNGGLSEDSTTGYHHRGISMAMKLAANDYIQFYNQNWYTNTSTAFDYWKNASVTFLG